jgi:hypothetical protein
MPSRARTPPRCNVPSICTRSCSVFLLLTYMINTSASLLWTSTRLGPLSDPTTSDQPCRSTSMTNTDRQPLRNTPMGHRIVARHNNRYGAVLSALWSFWHSRQVATRNAARSGARQDTYSIVLFCSTAKVKEICAVAIRAMSDLLFQIVAENNASSTAEQLVELLLDQNAKWGTHFDNALISAREIVERHTTSER